MSKKETKVETEITPDNEKTGLDPDEVMAQVQTAINEVFRANDGAVTVLRIVGAKNNC